MILRSASQLYSFFITLLNAVINFSFLGLLSSNLDSDKLGFWLVLISLNSLVLLIDLGFSSTFVRFFAFSFKKDDLVVENLPEQLLEIAKLNSFSQYNSLLLNLSKKVYSYLSYLGIFLSLIIGTLYLPDLDSSNIEKNWPLIWMALSLSAILNLKFSYLNIILLGRGLIIRSSFLQFVQKSMGPFLGILLIISGRKDILLISICYFISSLIYLLLGFYWKNKFFRIRNFSFSKKTYLDSFRRIWPVTWQLGLTGLCAFMGTKANILIGSSILGVDKTASYSLSITVIGAIYSLSLVPSNVIQPQLSYHFVNKNRAKFTEIYSESLIYGLFLAISGLGIFLVMGDNIILLLNSKTNLVGRIPFLILSIFSLLELNHTVACQSIASANCIPFLKTSTITSICSVLMTTFGCYFFGIWGCMFASGITHLGFNNWYWPIYSAKKFRYNVFTIYSVGIKNLFKKFNLIK